MNSRLAMIMMLMALSSTPATAPNPFHYRGGLSGQKSPPKGPRTVACSRCGAKPGEACDKRTLGRKAYHLARVTEWQKTTGARLDVDRSDT